MDKRVISAGDRFENWYSYNQEFKMLMRSHQDPSSSHNDAIEGQHKCIDIQCKHYVYGFDTDDALRRHISLHEAAQDNQARATSTIREKTSTMSLDDNLPVREMRRPSQTMIHLIQKLSVQPLPCSPHSRNANS